MDRYPSQLEASGPEFSRLVERIPLQSRPPLSPEWLRCEMLERHQVLRVAGISPGTSALEVGSGSHAIATVPLAFELGPEGRLIAVERSRWSEFQPVVTASGLSDRVRPVRGDARRLPFSDSAMDLALCIHGIRSLGSDEEVVTVIREMFRVAPRVVLAESLPLAESDAQAAHLAMYDLREPVFASTTGRADDRHYRPLAQLAELVERAGGHVERHRTVRVDLPHALAYFPRALAESVPDPEERRDLLRRWDAAAARIERYGADHPPVGLVEGRR